MTLSHHPTEATLAAFAAGTLEEGRMLVVAAHLAVCPDCRRIVRAMEGVGGALLDDVEPALVATDSLARAFAEIDRGGSVVHGVPTATGHERRAQWEDTAETAMDSPRATASDDPAESISGLRPEHARLLACYGTGPWRWIGPGVSSCAVDAPIEAGGRVFLLRAAGGTRMPDHTHTGTELTCVLTGAFSHENGRYGPGDVDEADDETDHRPIVEAGRECVCLVAMQGRLRLNGLMGRILQPFVRL